MLRLPLAKCSTTHVSKLFCPTKSLTKKLKVGEWYYKMQKEVINKPNLKLYRIKSELFLSEMSQRKTVERCSRRKKQIVQAHE